jgi:hypothetical protein
MNLFAQYRERGDQPRGDYAFHLGRLRLVIDAMESKDRFLGEWYLQGWTVAEAHRHRVYGDDHRPRPAALQEMEEEYRGKPADEPRIIGIWNRLEKDNGASLTVTIENSNELPKGIDLEMAEKAPGSSRLGDYRSVAEVITKVAEVYEPFYVMFGPRKYFMKTIFEDRPGASWMLYLPQVLTMHEVPEARDLIPVIVAGQQRGTIIVSEIDGVFSVDNPEHVKVANAIEIRLVDQDLLPRFVDL